MDNDEIFLDRYGFQRCRTRRLNQVVKLDMKYIQYRLALYQLTIVGSLEMHQAVSSKTCSNYFALHLEYVYKEQGPCSQKE